MDLDILHVESQCLHSDDLRMYYFNYGPPLGLPGHLMHFQEGSRWP